mgnify:CR=1 FL=1
MARLSEEKCRFVDFAIEAGVLRFGCFTLKSGRESPYFFNLGIIASGARLARLGEFYARALAALDPPIEVLFGPAYKGIPLAVTTACAYARTTGNDLAVAYNRKEAKDHGEGGRLVGAPLDGARVCIIDDVVTAGTAVREAIGLLRAAGATPVALIVAIDREERGRGEQSAMQELASEEGMSVTALISFSDVLAWLERAGGHQQALQALTEYRRRYGT